MNHYTSEDFFEALDQARKRQGLSVSELCRRSGVEISCLQASKRKRRCAALGQPCGHSLQTISRAITGLGISLEQWAAEVNLVARSRRRREGS